MKILLTAILTISLFTGCNDKHVENSTKQKNNSIFKASNSIVLKDIFGKEIRVKSLENGFIFQGYEEKIVLINFFTTWCPPCRAEIPHLNNLQKKYKDDLKIISVLLEKNKSNEDIINFINKNDIEFTITNSKDNYKLAKEVGGVRSIPLMLIYDRDGKYSQHYTGAVPEEMIDVDIKRIL
ncbi:MAG: TlpA family protein disulfide reductase [Sulfurospirillum sp.]|nr:TlpA family protein disulfide reductase [Sulfurospirillum sp.]